LVGDEVKEIVFDVFGTVVDWRASVIREGEELTRGKGMMVDCPRFTDEWRHDGYIAGMELIRRGELPWMKVDRLHRLMLNELLAKYGVGGLDEAEIAHFNRVWHRLSPWRDAVPGLNRLKERFLIAPLSNGDVALLTNIAKAGKLLGAFKPDLRVYLGAANLLDLPPVALLMVGAHKGDMRTARSAGLRTAFVPRALEWSPGRLVEPPPDLSFDLVAADFVDLAAKLGA
jgi:2-haloacid dehalogenase